MGFRDERSRDWGMLDISMQGIVVLGDFVGPHDSTGLVLGLPWGSKQIRIDDRRHHVQPTSPEDVHKVCHQLCSKEKIDDYSSAFVSSCFAFSWAFLAGQGEKITKTTPTEPQTPVPST